MRASVIKAPAGLGKTRLYAAIIARDVGRKVWEVYCATIELAKEFGIGCVALGNTNHWLRGGSYGWQAAEAGCVGICWTNTQPNMPAWGARDRRIGNNPFIMAVPREGGHVVVDIAMAQFSYGQMDNKALRGEMLPVPGSKPVR